MNSKKHGMSNQAVVSLDESEDGNPDDDDPGDNEDDENPVDPDNSSAPNADISDQTGKTLSPPTQPWTYKEGQFWNYVDNELANLRKLVQNDNLSISDADAQTTEYVLTHLIKSRSLI
jgi:hypothetical protein